MLSAQVVDQPVQAHHLPVQAQGGAVVEGAHAVLQRLDLGAHAASGVRSSCEASASQARRDDSMRSSRVAMWLKVRAKVASSSWPRAGMRVPSRPWAMPRAPSISSPIGANQRLASNHDSASASTSRPGRSRS